MWDWLNSPAVRTLLASGLLLVVVYVGFQVISRLRTMIITSETNGDDLAKNFEEMRLEGDIDEAELRKIKSVLGRSQQPRGGE